MDNTQKTIKTSVFDISLPRMQAIFEKMQNEAGWNMQEEMIWGYYFLDHNKQKLEAFGNKLQRTKYHIVEIDKTDESSLYRLHVEKNTTHTAKSLYEQCKLLAELANDDSIEIFDGWDVGKS